MNLSLNSLNYTAAVFHLVQAAIVLGIIQNINSSSDYGLKNGVFHVTKIVQVIIKQNFQSNSIEDKIWASSDQTSNNKCSLPSINFYNSTSTNNSSVVLSNTSSYRPDMLHTYFNKGLLITVKRDDFHTFDGQYYVIPQIAHVGEIDIRYIIFSFFLLSGMFQITDGIMGTYLYNSPRLLRFVEYSFSASIMIMSIAVQTGIQDIYTLCCMFTLIFATNILGLIAELLCYFAEAELSGKTAWAWTIPHFLGWITCLVAYAPLLDSFLNASRCSEKQPPGFVHVIVFLEFFLFSCFGFVQLYSLYYRTNCLLHPENSYNSPSSYNTIEDAPKTSTVIIRQADYMYITLSFVAKTLLAWLILSPTLV